MYCVFYDVYACIMKFDSNQDITQNRRLQEPINPKLEILQVMVSIIRILKRLKIAITQKVNVAFKSD